MALDLLIGVAYFAYTTDHGLSVVGPKEISGSLRLVLCVVNGVRRDNLSLTCATSKSRRRISFSFRRLMFTVRSLTVNNEYCVVVPHCRPYTVFLFFEGFNSFLYLFLRFVSRR